MKEFKEFKEFKGFKELKKFKELKETPSTSSTSSSPSTLKKRATLKQLNISCYGDQLNGLSPNGLWNGSLAPLLPLPLGGGFGGIAVIMTSEIVLSRIILVISGLVYDFFDTILKSMVFKCKATVSVFRQKYPF